MSEHDEFEEATGDEGDGPPPPPPQPDESDAESIHAEGQRRLEAAEILSPHIKTLRECRDPIELVDNKWLEIPLDKLDPLLECAVTVNTQVLAKSSLQPTGAEFVWVGLGHMLPENLARVAWCMEQIKKFGNYTGAVASTSDTKLIHNASVAAKKQPVSGIIQEFDRSSMVYSCKDTDFPDGNEYPSFIEMCMEDMRNRRVKDYRKVDMVETEWGMIPIQYEKADGEIVRDIVHVLRVVPAKGFDLLRFLDTKIFSQVNQRSANASVDVREVAHLLKVSVDYEIEALGDTSLWRDYPHPCTVLDSNSTTSVVSPFNVLSPFAVFFKIRRLIKGYKAGTLVIDGYPPLRTQAEMQAAIDHFRNLNRGYLAAMVLWRSEWFEANAKDDVPNQGGTVHINSVLTWGGKCLDRLNCAVNLKLNIQNGVYELKSFKEMMKLKLPDLVKAAITFFTFVDGNALFDDLQRLPFFETHIANQQAVVTPKYLYEKYHGSKEMINDFPYAGMYSHSWYAHELTLKNLVESGTDIEGRALATKRYITVQLTILSRSLLMDLFMSDRVLEQARILQKLSDDDICERVAFACKGLCGETQSDEMQLLEQDVIFDEMQWAEFITCSAWMTFNQSARMNASNLNCARAIVTSDILTFLGIHHKTWVWMGYTNIFAGGAGHMRALTEDAHGRVPAVYLIKANSAGYSQVVIKGFNNIQWMLQFICPGLRDEVIAKLQLQKIDRGTRPAMEGFSSLECIDGKVVTYPDRGTFMCGLYLDEWFRNLDKEGMKAIVTLLPRDSSAGTGCTFKKVEDPDRKQGMVNGKIQQLKGLCPNILAIAGNNQAPDPAFAEAAKSLFCTSNGMCPGAQPVDELQFEASKKRSRSMYQLTDSNGSSSLPDDPDVCVRIANILAVIPMITKQQLGLMNKTGLVSFEICRVHKQYLSWFHGFYKRMFKDCLGSTLLMSYDRITGIQVARTIASTVNTTMLVHIGNGGRGNSYNQACVDALGDCMSSALTVAKCGVVMRETIGKTLCTNVLMINGLIERLFQTPVVSLDFLFHCLDPRRSVPTNHDDFPVLKAFLEVSRLALIPLLDLVLQHLNH